MYPQSFIYFGVLHGMALMLIIARLTAPWGRSLWLLGAAAIAIQLIASYAMQTVDTAGFVDLFNAPKLNWLGIITRKPITEDYVPLLPWLGVMWWGVASGNWLTRQGTAWLSWPLPAALKPLTLLGRWSLSYYMLHQPLMIGVLMAVAWFAK
jgi:uncharacterized membrane protein